MNNIRILLCNCPCAFIYDNTKDKTAVDKSFGKVHTEWDDVVVNYCGCARVSENTNWKRCLVEHCLQKQLITSNIPYFLVYIWCVCTFILPKSISCTKRTLTHELSSTDENDIIWFFCSKVDDNTSFFKLLVNKLISTLSWSSCWKNDFHHGSNSRYIQVLVDLNVLLLIIG